MIRKWYSHDLYNGNFDPVKITLILANAQFCFMKHLIQSKFLIFAILAIAAIFFYAENPTPEHYAVVTMHNFNDAPAYGNGKEHGFKTGKHKLFPFPDLETSINPNIVQTPGW